MKLWFKYKYGFINIKDDCIYLTSSGNWSETNHLLEKGIQKQNHIRKLRIQFFLIIIALSVETYIILKLENNLLSFISIGSTVMGLALVYKYLKPELGDTFKLPIEKIKKIEIDSNSVTLTFTDGKQQENTQLIHQPEQKGLAFFKLIQSSSYTSASSNI